jgi:hypothetical protein
MLAEIQRELGVTSGDFASHHFSDGMLVERIASDLHAYIRGELDAREDPKWRAFSFEQFQASRKRSECLQEELSSHLFGELDCGYIYLGALHIDEVAPHWPDRTRAKGKWHLIIGREEWVTDDLESLERKLYEFALSEDYTLADAVTP